MHVGIANLWWRGKRSRHSRRMRNPQVYVSGKRPIPSVASLRPFGIARETVLVKHIDLNQQLLLNVQGISIHETHTATTIVTTIDQPIDFNHYRNVIMSAIASQITSLTIVYSAVYSDADQRKHQISASLAFVQGIHRIPVNSPHKRPVTRKMLSFDDIIMNAEISVTMLWLRVIEKAYWWPSRLDTVQPFLDPQFTKMLLTS